MIPVSRHAPPDPVSRLFSSAALLVSLCALVFAMSGLAPAEHKPSHHRHGKGGKAGKALKKRLNDLQDRCATSNSVDLGTWCLESTPFSVPVADAGKNNYFYATQKCVAEGGWLPTAAQLIGAAPTVALQSTIDDDPATSGVEEIKDPRLGIKDKREMSADLFVTAAGSAAAGSEGVTAGSKGNSSIGEPDPVPAPADPSPETLDYVTVYDNHNLGGFAGGAPVGKAESFRCAYAKGYQGKPRNVSSRP